MPSSRTGRSILLILFLQGGPKGQVIVEDAESAPSDDLEEWYRELQELGPGQFEPGEWERVQATLAEADALAKAVIRRQMGVS